MKLCMICHFEDLKCKIQIFLTVYFCTNTVKVNLFLHTGQAIDVVVERTEPAVGTVTVDWNIQGQNGLAPSSSFQQNNGSLVFTEVSLQCENLLFI